MVATSGTTGTQAFFMHQAGAVGAAVIGHKSRNATVGSHTAVNNGDDALALVGAVSDGVSAYLPVGSIVFEAAETSSPTASGGRIVFSTTTAATSTLSERMRLTEDGYLGFGTTSPEFPLHWFQRQVLTDTPVTVACFESSSVAAGDVGLGVAVEYRSKAFTNENEFIGRQTFTWSDVTPGSEDSFCTIRLSVGGVATEAMRITGTTLRLGSSGTQVLTTRQTGWAAATGTATRTAFATSTVTTEQLAQRVKALIDDLISHGLIGA